MSKKTTKENAAVAVEKNIVRIAAIANAYGNVRICLDRYGTNSLVVPGLRPDDTDGFIPISIIRAFLESDVRSSRLVLAVCKALADGIKGVRPTDFVNDAIRRILAKMKIKATYILHQAGEVYTDEKTGETGAYTKDWYELDTQSIRLSYGENKDAYLNCDASAFIAESSMIEDF